MPPCAKPRPLNLEPPPPTYVSDRRVRTAGAAALAIRVVQAVQNRNAKDSSSLGEDVLFPALQTCAYRAGPAAGANGRSADRRAWTERYRALREHVVELNLGLAYSMVRRFKCHASDHDDLVSDALFALVRAIDRFNPWQGCRFSTYACTAIARALINRGKQRRRLHQQFPFRHDVSFEMSERVDTQAELYAERLRRALDANLGALNELERQVLAQRFPLDHTPQVTLGQIGHVMGLSKERIRQIQNKALLKLRDALAADPALG